MDYRIWLISIWIQCMIFVDFPYLIFYFSELIKVEKSNLRNDYGAYISKLVNSSNSDQGSTGLDKNVLTDHMSRVNLERDQVKALYKKGMKEKSRNNLWFLIILSPVN